MTSIVALLILLITVLALVAYHVVGRLEGEPSQHPTATPTSYEGVITARDDCPDGTTRLWLRGADQTIREIQVTDPLTPAGVRVGQRVRVHGVEIEVPDVRGAIVDLREPPEGRRVVRAIAIHQIDPITDEEMFQWKLAAVFVGVSVSALATLPRAQLSAIVLLPMLVWFSFAIRKARG